MIHRHFLVAGRNPLRWVPKACRNQIRGLASWRARVLCGLIALLTPDEHPKIQYRPGFNLHHTLSARNGCGVRNAVCADLRRPDDNLPRYVRVELDPGGRSGAGDGKHPGARSLFVLPTAALWGSVGLRAEQEQT